MREPKFDVGDVVRIVDMEFTRAVFDKIYDKMARVEEVTIRANSTSYWIRTDDGAAGYINEELLEGVPLEEVQSYYADKPRRGFIVDGLTVDETLVDELESGQDEAYVSFQRAAKEAETVNERREKRARRDLITMIVCWIAANVIAMLAWLVCLDRLEETMPALIGMYSTVMGVLSVIEMALMTGAWKWLRKRGEE